MRSINQLSDLNGRVALITGGAGHLGAAMAEALAEAGANIAILDVNERAAAEVISSLDCSAKQKHIHINEDITTEDGVAAIYDKISDTYQHLEILINCAALVGDSSLRGWAVDFEKQELQAWNKALDVNITSCFLLSKTLLPLLRKTKKASIINVSSIYGVYGQKRDIYGDSDYLTPAAYAVSKGGMVQFSKYLSSILGPDIRVNTISPGGIFRQHDKGFQERYTKYTPLNRMGNEEDFKGAALFLASDLSSYVTGQNLIIDGGWGG